MRHRGLIVQLTLDMHLPIYDFRCNAKYFCKKLKYVSDINALQTQSETESDDY